jgi:lysophospholipase
MGGTVIPGLTPDTCYPESRVLIIMTGGTICMQPSEDGLVPMNGFLEKAMAPRPSFNDKSAPEGMYIPHQLSPHMAYTID